MINLLGFLIALFLVLFAYSAFFITLFTSPIHIFLGLILIGTVIEIAEWATGEGDHHV